MVVMASIRLTHIKIAGIAGIIIMYLEEEEDQEEAS
jgi:hypothetical protein